MRQNRSIAPDLIRVGDLNDSIVVWVQCWKCKHIATLANHRLKRARPAAMRLIDVSFKMKCTACGVRGAQTITVQRLPNHA